MEGFLLGFKYAEGETPLPAALILGISSSIGPWAGLVKPCPSHIWFLGPMALV